MLLDNKTQSKENQYYKVLDYIKNYTESGKLDIVTGFFSVNALSLIYDQINQANRFRLVLGNMMQEEAKNEKIVDLLSDDSGIESSLNLSLSAQKAVEFLQQEKVKVKTVQKNFCHAKAYVYEDEDSRKNYHIIGSSNLTDAGLGLRESSNVELNTAFSSDSNDWKEVKNWFEQLWKQVAQEYFELPDKTKINTKQYIIDLITNLYKEYSPKDLYFKVLYELFKDDLLSLRSDKEFEREMKHLCETVIYQTLFPYQQKGVISLIKMLRDFNGAILADAVGLGKTWTALAVMKYFQSNGYQVILFCPKKLRNNWEQYQSGKDSRFEKDDIEYLVRNHTDLQDDRLDLYTDFPLSKIQRSNRKLLIVIDESHNLRNDKSSRYKFLVEKILQPEKVNREVKVLQLSATPINNRLLDIRNQFKLIRKGQDNGFADSKLQIASLENIFRIAQKDYSEWCSENNHKIASLIKKLNDDFFKLTDSLIVARTRKMIVDEFGEINFPEKEKPLNEYIAPKNIGNLISFDDILNAIEINMTAYRPSAYIKERKLAESVLQDEVARETFLVKMMQILMIKRLESSWFSFKKTVEKILTHHENALSKVIQFIENKRDVAIIDNITEEDNDDLEDAADQTTMEDVFTLGKKNPVKLSEITAIKTFQNHLERDVKKLKSLKTNLDAFEHKFNETSILQTTPDTKLERLVEIITEKQKKENRKVLIFTVYSDTAKFLYDQLKKRKIANIAYMSGSQTETFDGYGSGKFEPILERFAPYTKLFNEKDWSEKPGSQFMQTSEFESLPKEEKYAMWKEWILKTDNETARKLNNPIDILIATDCLSEGQNLQDCDLVVNYDIHWNPVRLIQRMGRIDRLASPNKTIKGINFWPAKDYEDYLNLKSRVENRMAAMTLVGTEIDDTLTSKLQEIVKENPLLPEQTQRMLEQLQMTWDDVEDSAETLGLNDLSLEQFRQELFEYFKQNEEYFRQIPNSVFTGFKFYPNLKWQQIPDSIVAILGYPQNKDKAKDFVYQEIHLLHQNYGEETTNMVLLHNRQEILSFLRSYKDENRYVPKEIDSGDTEAINKLAKAVEKWLTAQANPVAVNQIQDLFTGGLVPATVSSGNPKVEEKFRAENFDLINWFVVSK